MNRLFALGLAVLATLPADAVAQQVGPVIRYGKWVLAAGAVGMNLLAAQSHNDADDAFERVEDACLENDLRCILTPDGTYADPLVEADYQSSLHHDRMARRWLIFGETALVGAAAMFVWEFTRKKHEPDNIPFEPEVTTLRDGTTRFGLRVAF
jgi:hypothetical protein